MMMKMMMMMIRMMMMMRMRMRMMMMMMRMRMMMMMMIIMDHIYIYILKVHRHGISKIHNPSAILARSNVRVAPNMFVATVPCIFFGQPSPKRRKFGITSSTMSFEWLQKNIQSY